MTIRWVLRASGVAAFDPFLRSGRDRIDKGPVREGHRVARLGFKTFGAFFRRHTQMVETPGRRKVVGDHINPRLPSRRQSARERQAPDGPSLKLVRNHRHIGNVHLGHVAVDPQRFPAKKRRHLIRRDVADKSTIWITCSTN